MLLADRCLLLLFPLTMGIAVAFAQEHRERTLEEIKTESIRRAEQGIYPLIGVDGEDVRQAFQSIHSKDQDEWAAAFINIGDRYMRDANSETSSDPAKANANYTRAWRIYSFARWPVPSSPGKQKAYDKAVQAYLAHAKFLDPPLEVVHIPFAASEVIGYLRLPKNSKTAVPLVIAVNGLDSRKEDLAESFAPILAYGIGVLAVDGPGTGQAPIKVTPTADRMLSRVIDYAQSRPEIDGRRLALHGVSWGAYWATKMAIVEHSRLRGASALSPPVDKFFRRDYLVNQLLGNREYLFDQVPALMSILEGVTNLDEMAALFSRLSLMNDGLLGQPMCPMLIVGGVLDTQVPIDDLYLLLSKGDVPKTAWINPQGGHLGRQVKVWPDPLILRRIVVPWLVGVLDQQPAAGESQSLPSTAHSLPGLAAP
ncbi:MAG: alpha/beta fold hydrolase [Acidobacteria bacterium]|nr:alpha/beta fold hydrolase [Acidobacteriota bacterium]